MTTCDLWRNKNLLEADLLSLEISDKTSPIYTLLNIRTWQFQGVVAFFNHQNDSTVIENILWEEMKKDRSFKDLTRIIICWVILGAYMITTYITSRFWTGIIYLHNPIKEVGYVQTLEDLENISERKGIKTVSGPFTWESVAKSLISETESCSNDPTREKDSVDVQTTRKQRIYKISPRGKVMLCTFNQWQYFWLIE